MNGFSHIFVVRIELGYVDIIIRIDFGRNAYIVEWFNLVVIVQIPVGLSKKPALLDISILHLGLGTLFQLIEGSEPRYAI